MCRKALGLSSLNRVSRDQNAAPAPPSDSLTNKYGIKMATLIRLINQVLDENAEHRIIVFSQWDDMLSRIGGTLSSNGIKSLFCRGTVVSRNRVLKTFKSNEPDAPRVLMLSLESAASGTNLVEASHVVLVDPVAGTKSHADATEAQAIARAHRIGQNKQVKVVRLIIRDTIEQRLHERE